MLMFIGDIVAGALGFVGQERANAAQISSARDAQAFSASEARKQRKFQKEMSNTAVQRRFKDLLAAGVNPILAGKYDASTPAGAAGSGFQADVGNSIGEGISSAMSMRRLRSDMKSAEESRKQLKSNTALNHLLGEKTMMETESAKEKAWQDRLTTDMMYEQKPYLKKMFKTLGEFEGTKLGERLRLLKEFIPFFNSAKGFAR